MILLTWQLNICHICGLKDEPFCLILGGDFTKFERYHFAWIFTDFGMMEYEVQI